MVAKRWEEMEAVWEAAPLIQAAVEEDLMEAMEEMALTAALAAGAEEAAAM